VREWLVVALPHHLLVVGASGSIYGSIEAAVVSLEDEKERH